MVDKIEIFRQFIPLFIWIIPLSIRHGCPVVHSINTELQSRGST